MLWRAGLTCAMKINVDIAVRRVESYMKKGIFQVGSRFM